MTEREQFIDYSREIVESWQRLAPSYTLPGSLPPKTWRLFELGCTVEQFEAAYTEALADKSIPRRKCLDRAHAIIRARLGGDRG